MREYSEKGSHSEVREYRLQNMKMHESIVKQVYLDGNKYEIRQEDGIIEDDNRNGYEGREGREQYDFEEAKSKEKEKKRKKNKGSKDQEGKNPNKVTIQTYNPSDGPWWQTLFPCCCSATVVEPQFEDCGQCGRRVYADESDSSEQEPYISHQRMQVREKQSINVFYDRIKNNELMKTSWE